MNIYLFEFLMNICFLDKNSIEEYFIHYYIFKMFYFLNSIIFFFILGKNCRHSNLINKLNYTNLLIALNIFVCNSDDYMVF